MAYLEVIVVAVSSLFVLLTGALAEQTTCQVVPPCSCSMSDGSGLIDLHRLQMSTYGIDADNTTTYSYQPCLGMQSANGCNNSDAVLCKTVLVNGKLQHVMVAIATGEYFNVSSNGSVTIEYTMNDDRSRSVYVQLVCKAGPNSTFEEIEQPNGHGSQSDLHFKLESSGACLFNTSANHSTTAAPISHSTTVTPTVHPTEPATRNSKTATIATHSAKPAPTATYVTSTSSTTNITTPTVLPTVTPKLQSSCSLSDCAEDLEIAIPVTAVGVSLTVLVVSCLVLKWKDKRAGRYKTL